MIYFYWRLKYLKPIETFLIKKARMLHNLYTKPPASPENCVVRKAYLKASNVAWEMYVLPEIGFKPF